MLWEKCLPVRNGRVSSDAVRRLLLAEEHVLGGRASTLWVLGLQGEGGYASARRERSDPVLRARDGSPLHPAGADHTGDQPRHLSGLGAMGRDGAGGTNTQPADNASLLTPEPSSRRSEEPSCRPAEHAFPGMDVNRGEDPQDQSVCQAVVHEVHRPPPLTRLTGGPLCPLHRGPTALRLLSPQRQTLLPVESQHELVIDPPPSLRKQPVDRPVAPADPRLRDRPDAQPPSAASARS